MSNDYILKTQAQLTTKGIDLVCPRCKKPVRNGDRVHRKVRYRRLRPNGGTYYHERCWNNLFL